MARSGRDTGVLVKVKAHALHEQGISNAAIGRVLDVTHQAVGGWLRAGTGLPEYRRRKAAGQMPALSADEAARLLVEVEAGRAPDTQSEARAAEAGRGAVLRLHQGEGIGPLVTPAAVSEFGAAAGRCLYLWRCLVFAGVDYDEALDWGARCDMGDPETRALRNAYQQAYARGGKALLDSVWDGEGAPATAWQVAQRVLPEFAEAAESAQADPLADEATEDLLDGLDAAVAELAG